MVSADERDDLAATVLLPQVEVPEQRRTKHVVPLLAWRTEAAHYEVAYAKRDSSPSPAGPPSALARPRSAGASDGHVTAVGRHQQFQASVWWLLRRQRSSQPAVSVDPRSVRQLRKRDDARGLVARTEPRPWPDLRARTERRYARDGDRQQVGSLVERVADVPLDPVPANLLLV